MSSFNFLIYPITDRKFNFPILAHSSEDISRFICAIVGDREGISLSRTVLDWCSDASPGDSFTLKRFKIICK